MPTQLKRIPAEPGVYIVETVSGTIHVISTVGRATWERRPAPGAVAARYDNLAVTLSELGPGWEVGNRGSLLVADETYETGATWHLTAQIVSIVKEPKS